MSPSRLNHCKSLCTLYGQDALFRSISYLRWLNSTRRRLQGDEVNGICRIQPACGRTLSPLHALCRNRTKSFQSCSGFRARNSLRLLGVDDGFHTETNEDQQGSASHRNFSTRVLVTATGYIYLITASSVCCTNFAQWTKASCACNLYPCFSMVWAGRYYVQLCGYRGLNFFCVQSRKTFVFEKDAFFLSSWGKLGNPHSEVFLKSPGRCISPHNLTSHNYHSHSMKPSPRPSMLSLLSPFDIVICLGVEAYEASKALKGLLARINPTIDHISANIAANLYAVEQMLYALPQDVQTGFRADFTQLVFPEFPCLRSH